MTDDTYKPPGVFIRISELQVLLKVSRATISNWRKRGILPQPLKIGPNTIGYQSETIGEFIRTRDPAETRGETIPSEEPTD